MYLILTRYVKPVEEVDAAIPAHRAYLDGLYASGKLLCSGPRVPRTGGVIVALVDSEVEATKIVADDPFFTGGIAEYDLVRFEPVKHAPVLESVLAGG